MPEGLRSSIKPSGRVGKVAFPTGEKETRLSIQLWVRAPPWGSPGFPPSVVAPEQLASCRWAWPAPASRTERSQQLQGAAPPRQPTLLAE